MGQLSQEQINVDLFDEVKRLKDKNRKLKAFYNYFSELYGQGLGIANWHQNGELEPFDNFFDSAEQELE